MTHTKDEASVKELQRYSPDGEGGMELDSLGAYVKLQDVTTPPAAQPAPVQPVAWMFQHGETGRMNYLSNDGMNSPSTFVEMNPRYALVCPLYTSPPAQPAAQEPVAWVNHGENRITRATGWDGYGALYTTPPAQPAAPLTDELSNAVQMACQLSFKDHGRRSVNEQAWQRLMQALAAYTHGITTAPEKGN
jgi:hypothetical protein